MPDGHDGLGPGGEPVPGIVSGIENGVVGLEDATGEPSLAQVLPKVLDRVQLQ